MSETKQLPNRSDLTEKETWDLTPIFESDAAFDTAFEALTKKLEEAPPVEKEIDEEEQSDIDTKRQELMAKLESMRKGVK